MSKKNEIIYFVVERGFLIKIFWFWP